MIARIPYGKTRVELELPYPNVTLLQSRDAQPARSPAQEIRRALENPVGAPRLADLSLKGKKICIVVSDYTRAVPNRLLTAQLLDILEKAGCNPENAAVLVANGLHKPAPRWELAELLGEETMERVDVVNHDAEDEDSLDSLGRTSFGTELKINRVLTGSDLAILTGLIEPHFFAGYSGGRKSVLPGVAGAKTIYQNHSFKMINPPGARYGVLKGTPIHEDMAEAARLSVKKGFLLNVVIDKQHRLLKAFAGDIFAAHREGVKFLDRLVKVKAGPPADIVVTSNGGYPLDRDLYQAVKGMATGELVVRKGGAIITFAECIDGVGRGHDEFRRLMAEASTPQQVLEEIKRNEPIRDQWEAQVLARILCRAEVIVVTKGVKHSVLEEMHLTPASTPDEAVELALETVKQRNPRITVIPEGPYVIPVPG